MEGSDLAMFKEFMAFKKQLKEAKKPVTVVKKNTITVMTEDGQEIEIDLDEEKPVKHAHVLMETKGVTKKKNKVVCIATCLNGDKCTKEACHKDGYCGTHHSMKKSGKTVGEKKKMPVCAGRCKDGSACRARATHDSGVYCYSHA